MNILPERRKWLADRLRQVAAEEEAAGAKETAAEFLRRAREVESGVICGTRVKVPEGGRQKVAKAKR
jgi:hypothetical protein